MAKRARRKAPPRTRTVRVKPYSYQPNKAELEENVHIDATPHQLAKAVLSPVKVVKER